MSFSRPVADDGRIRIRKMLSSVGACVHAFFNMTSLRVGILESTSLNSDETSKAGGKRMRSTFMAMDSLMLNAEASLNTKHLSRCVMSDDIYQQFEHHLSYILKRIPAINCEMLREKSALADRDCVKFDERKETLSSQMQSMKEVRLQLRSLCRCSAIQRHFCGCKNIIRTRESTLLLSHDLKFDELVDKLESNKPSPICDICQKRRIASAVSTSMPEVLNVKTDSGKICCEMELFGSTYTLSGIIVEDVQTKEFCYITCASKMLHTMDGGSTLSNRQYKRILSGRSGHKARILQFKNYNLSDDEFANKTVETEPMDAEAVKILEKTSDTPALIKNSKGICSILSVGNALVGMPSKLRKKLKSMDLLLGEEIPDVHLLARFRLISIFEKVAVYQRNNQFGVFQPPPQLMELILMSGWSSSPKNNSSSKYNTTLGSESTDVLCSLFEECRHRASFNSFLYFSNESQTKEKLQAEKLHQMDINIVIPSTTNQTSVADIISCYTKGDYLAVLSGQPGHSVVVVLTTHGDSILLNDHSATLYNREYDHFNARAAICCPKTPATSIDQTFAVAILPKNDRSATKHPYKKHYVQWVSGLYVIWHYDGEENDWSKAHIFKCTTGNTFSCVSYKTNKVKGDPHCRLMFERGATTEDILAVALTHKNCGIKKSDSPRNLAIGDLKWSAFLEQNKANDRLPWNR